LIWFKVKLVGIAAIWFTLTVFISPAAACNFWVLSLFSVDELVFVDKSFVIGCAWLLFIDPFVVSAVVWVVPLSFTWVVISDWFVLTFLWVGFCFVVDSFTPFILLSCVLTISCTVVVLLFSVCTVPLYAALAQAMPDNDRLAINRTVNNSFFVIIPPPFLNT